MILKSLINWLKKIVGEERLLHHFSGSYNKSIIGLKEYGYLHDEGWMESFKRKESVDKEGNPTPWLSYPLVDFMAARLRKEFSVFEYGGGNSTLYYSARVKEVHVVESDRDWFEKIKKEAGPNTFAYYQSVDSNPTEYIQKPKQLDKSFDIIIVDGMERIKCLSFCKEYLTERGVIVADDTNTYDYGTVIGDLMDLGFKRLDFSGMSSFVISKKTSTLLYRVNNCFDI
jgi:hypothetical protein